jgi:hypothetical protein
LFIDHSNGNPTDAASLFYLYLVPLFLIVAAIVTHKYVIRDSDIKFAPGIGVLLFYVMEATIFLIVITSAFLLNS